MRKSILVILFIAFSAITFQSCKNSVSFKVGMTVAAKWTDNNYYLATITSINGDKYAVDYTDGSKGEVKATDLKVTNEKSELKAGNKVLAVWAGSKFYSGTIKEMKENGAVITWDDGTADSEVAFGKILKTE